MSKVPFKVIKQGHIWVEVTSLWTWKPGFRSWYIQTEQKHPSGFAVMHNNTDGTVLLSKPYEGETLHLREGEDGSECTYVNVHLPRPFPWRVWSITTHDDKWGVQVVAWTERDSKAPILDSMLWAWRNWLWRYRRSH